MATDREARNRIKELAARVDAALADDDARIETLRTVLDQLTVSTAEGLADHDARLDAGVESFQRIDQDLAQARGELTKLTADLRDATVKLDAEAIITANLLRRVEALEGNNQPDPPDPPPTGTWKPLLDLSRVSAWDGVHESAPGATIRDMPDGSIRLYKPQPGERSELSHHDLRITEGGTYRYTWDVLIDPSTRLDTAGSGMDTVEQNHPDERGGYGGGLLCRASDKMLVLRVRGGKELSRTGSHRYEYQSDGEGGGADGKGNGVIEPASKVEVGILTFGTRHRIVMEARWSKQWDGFVRVSLDGGPWVGVEDVPTMGERANTQMWCLGWYSGSGTAAPKDMRVWNAKVEVAA